MVILKIDVVTNLLQKEFDTKWQQYNQTDDMSYYASRVTQIIQKHFPNSAANNDNEDEENRCKKPRSGIAL